MSFELYLQQAIAYHNQGRLDEAEALYRQCLAINPRNADVLNFLGLIAQARGCDNNAIELFYAAIASSPFHQPYHFNLALSLENLEKYIEAIEAYQKAGAIKETHNNLGNIYKKLNQIDKARQEYQKALDIDANFEEAEANLAFSFLNDGVAIEKLEVLKENALASYYLALICFENLDYEKALKYALQANQLSPCLDYTNSLLGQIFYAQQNWVEAKTYFLKTLAINEFNAQALLLLANIQTNQAEYQEAEQNYKKLLMISSNHIDAHLNYANLLYLQKRTAESLEEYRKVIMINPYLSEASNNLAVIMKDLQNYDEAIGLFFNALVLKPELEEISINLLETLIIYAQNNHQEALKIAQNWHKTYPENVFAKHLLASLEGQEATTDLLYNQKVFDFFAPSYEQTLKNIKYNLPQQALNLVGQPDGKILDLGCGTGLLAESIKNSNNQIVGVDLSAKMIEIAEQKNLYNQLVQQDCYSYLKNHQNFDFIFALDVFCYIGNIEPILKLLKGKKFLFSVEVDENIESFKIQPNGRYKHNPQYIQNILGIVAIKNTVLRQENGIDVKGAIFYSI